MPILNPGRYNTSTATLLKELLAGAASNGAETELIHLYDLSYTGCRSCFACKRLGSPTYGRCAYPDEHWTIIFAVIIKLISVIGR